MLAVLLREPGGPEALEVVEQPLPLLQPGQVLVEAEAIGLGRPDVMMRTGKYKWMPPLPGVIGNELAGRVVAMSDGTDAALLGRRVLVSGRELPTRGGCYAQKVAVDADALIVLPESIDARSAVTLPNYQLAWGLLHEATRGKLPRSVYVNGAAGGVGSAVIQLCAQLGIDVVAGASSGIKREFVLQQGAREAVDTSKGADELVAAVLKATQGAGVDLVLDHVAGHDLIPHLGMLAPFGLLVSYNALKGAVEGDLFAAQRALAAKAIGVTAYNMHAYNGPSMKAARRALLETPMQWMASGRIKPAIGPVFALYEVGEAHRLLDSRVFTGKIVLVP